MLENECMTQSELTEYLGVQPGSASEVIGKLESAGLIVRTPSEKDRRQRIFVLPMQEGQKQKKRRSEEENAAGKCFRVFVKRTNKHFLCCLKS